MLGGDDSVVRRAVRRARLTGVCSALTEAAGHAVLLRHARRLAARLGLTAAASLLDRTVENARLYRWFRRDDESTPLVVDLGATRLVGPVVRAADRAGVVANSYWTVSRSRRLLSRIDDSLRGSVAASALLGLVGRSSERPPADREENR
jgi:uncharacterized protein (DUF2236 family)